MKSNTRILKFVAAAVLVTGSLPVASAAGLLGERYAAATFDWVFPDDNDVDNGRGVTLTLNQPLTTSIDLALTYSYLDTGANFGFGNIDISGQNLMFGGTYHMQAQGMKPFIGVSAGWLGTKVDGSTDNDTVFQIVPGVEIPAGEKASLRLYAAYSDYFDNEPEDEGVWSFGAVADFDINETWGLLTEINLDEDSNWGLSFGALVRF